MKSNSYNGSSTFVSYHLAELFPKALPILVVALSNSGDEVSYHLLETINNSPYNSPIPIVEMVDSLNIFALIFLAVFFFNYEPLSMYVSHFLLTFLMRLFHKPFNSLTDKYLSVEGKQ